MGGGILTGWMIEFWAPPGRSPLNRPRGGLNPRAPRFRPPRFQGELFRIFIARNPVKRMYAWIYLVVVIHLQ